MELEQKEKVWNQKEIKFKPIHPLSKETIEWLKSKNSKLTCDEMMAIASDLRFYTDLKYSRKPVF